MNRSPIYALLGESVDGMIVIRAFQGAQQTLLRRLMIMFDAQQHPYFLTYTGQSWLAVRLELIGTLIITFACLCAVLEHTLYGPNEKFAGLAGLAISYALAVTQSLNWSVRMASDMDANMVAVERVQEYMKLDSEASRNTDLDDRIVWPTRGEIEFRHVKLRYRPELPMILKGLTLRIPGGAKVGVVGRTGAGKSTIMVALMRIVEVSDGTIYIDDVDTSKVGLSKLRSSMAVIPQDPTLFSGTIRNNLDPFGDYNDTTLLETLVRVGLYNESDQSSHNGVSLGFSHQRRHVRNLDDVVAEGGSNYSVGQRQLLVIARALLREAKIILLDEATAAVDAETDAAIQRVIRMEFGTATCITIAHRINTIMDSDYILVMDDGVAAEFDTPDNLLQQESMYRDLVQASSGIVQD
jgi:ATP-binding cassette, subfamily C (CFTR/MRP), member 1